MGSNHVLEDASATNGTPGGLCLASLKTGSTADAERLTNFDLTFNVRLTSASGYAGVSFRQTQPTDAPWASGYMVYVKEDGSVNLYRGGPATTYQGLLDGDPTVGDGVELKLVVRGDRLRVFEAQSITPVIDVVDATFSGGHLSLMTLNAAAYFSENLTLTRLDQQIFGDFFENYSTGSLGSPWTSVVGWTVDGDSQTPSRLKSSSSVNSFAVIDGLTVDDVRITGRIEPGIDNTSGALHVRKTSDGAAPWAAGSGYSALVNRFASEAPDGRLALYCKDCVDVGSAQLATVALGPMNAGGYVVDLVAIGDRVQVYVDDELKIDHWETAANRPTSGSVGVSALGIGNTTHIDELFVFEPFPELLGPPPAPPLCEPERE